MAGATGKSLAGRFGVHVAVLVFVVDLDHPDARHPGLVAARQGPDHRVGLVELVLELHARPRPAGCRPPRRRSRRTASSSSKATSSATVRPATSAPSASSRRARREYRGRHDGRPRRRRHLQVNADGSFVMTSPKAFEGERGQRVYYASSAPPKFTTDNYQTVLFSEGIGRSFINSLTVTIPATDHPDPDRRLRRLRAGLDALSRPRAADRGHHRPAGRAAADVADPAA